LIQALPGIVYSSLRIVEMQNTAFLMLLVFFSAVYLPAASQTKDEIISSDALISHITGTDADKRGSALKYIDQKKPSDLPDLVADFLLGQRDLAEKQYVLAALSKYPNHTAMKVYLNVLDKTSSFMIKKQLIDLLGKTNDRAIVVPVSKELSSPFSSVRESAILALRNLGDDRMFPAIFAMSENKDPVFRIYALESLYYLYDLRLFSIIQTLLQDENKAVRLLAVKCAEQNALDKLLPGIRTIALSDSNNEVRIQAVATIGKMNDAGGLYVLLRLCSAEDRGLRLAAARVLAKIKSRQSTYTLSEQLAVETDGEIKFILLDTLIDMRDAGGYRGFEKMLSDPALSLRIRAAWGLGLIGGPKGIQILIKAVKDPEYRVRAEVCNSLGNFRDRSIVIILNSVVKEDTERYVRLAALYSLDRLRDKTAAIPLFDQYSIEKDPVFKMKLFEITRVLIQNSI
jgi:HEAT repeat protein